MRAQAFRVIGEFSSIQFMVDLIVYFDIRKARPALAEVQRDRWRLRDEDRVVLLAAVLAHHDLLNEGHVRLLAHFEELKRFRDALAHGLILGSPEDEVHVMKVKKGVLIQEPTVFDAHRIEEMEELAADVRQKLISLMLLLDQIEPPSPAA